MAKKTKIAWILAEDKAGMLNQALGLGEAVQRKLIEKNVNLELDVRPISVPGFKKYLPNQLWLSGLAGIKDLSGKGFQRPWPDMVISAARKAARPASEIKKKALRDGKDVFAIHIQRPGIDMNNFDIVTCPVHDQMRGDNLIETIGSPGRVSKDKLEVAARDFAEKFEVYRRPLIAVSIGGRSKVYDFGISELKALADNLRILAKKSDGSLLITASRRSPP
ncbi:MAG: ELM1/GtrOC1 family putative glycosyltransferase, partial [Alphaproteobacteria bacterium]|nr:ELM1/GtrOC1 family putative glycosyltransferase [Alphaproteobacteria bacterium]